MLNEVLGDELFFKGINSYLTTYEYSNAEQSQLYTAINEVINEIINEVINGVINEVLNEVINWLLGPELQQGVIIIGAVQILLKFLANPGSQNTYGD
jgi:hypothetical protein